MKQNFENKLKEILKKDIRFIDEEDFNRDEIITCALKSDKELISLLIEEKEIRETFFDKINDYWVFHINKFIDYVQTKNVFDNSHTKFKEKIGLNVDGSFLRERGEVSLVWPFKDCVLEGGMIKEDQKKDEIFFNEILAKDEIDRLEDTKVLTNFKKYTSKGEEKVKDFNRDEKGVIKDNLIIKGNNLLALHSLKKEFTGKIKLIYIDPPYNTGNDSFGYNDHFNHSTWLTFMKNRLEVARDLLKDDGVIFISCDDNEQAYLKVLCDEIFRKNLKGVLSVVVKPEGRNYGSIAKTHEFLLCYSKTFETELNEIEVKDKKFDYKDESGLFNLKELVNGNSAFNKENRPNLFYPLYVNLENKDKNGLSKVCVEKLKNFKEVLPKVTKNKQLVWRWSKEKVKNENSEVVAKIKQNGSIGIYQKTWKNTTLCKSLWNEKEFYTLKGNQELETLFGRKVFSNPKPSDFIKRIIQISTNKDDIILDFFSGSGTSGHATLKFNKEDGGNRKFILIEQLDDHIKVCKQRIQKVMKSEKLDDNFIYCELKKYNQEAIEKIQSTKDTKQLLKIWEEMCRNYFLNYDVDIKKFNENKKDFEKLNLTQQKKLLIEMLNKNQLYVNLSEIDDVQFKISKEDKELNKKFWKK